MQKKIKIGLITSRGGHLFQIYLLKKLWQKYPHFWVTFPGEDVNSLLDKEKKYYAFYPESRNLFNAFLNLFFAIKVIRNEKPDVLISSGAGISPPFFYIGKLFGCKLIFIEPYDFIQFPTLSAKLIEPIADLLLVQHKKQILFFKNAHYWGSIL